MRCFRLLVPAVCILVATAFLAISAGTAVADDDIDRRAAGDSGAVNRAPTPAGGPGPAAPLTCGGTPVGFDSGIPADWTVEDNAGNGVVWTSVAASGEAGNFTSGPGDAASVSSDANPNIEFDTELRSPTVSLAGYANVSLAYVANYQNFLNEDFLQLDISRNNGLTWAPLLSWNEDHGSFRSTPGELVIVNLDTFAGLSGVKLRWHYFDPGSNDFQWYAQIDHVFLNCTNAINAQPFGCNNPGTGFDSGIPANWTAYDNAGNGVFWQNVAGSGEEGNFTGGLGDAASASSDEFGPAEFDTELRTPSFSLQNYENAALLYRANYQNFGGRDFLDLDISTNGGASWTTVTSWNEDHGTSQAAPGEVAGADLTPYVGNPNVMLRWHYYDPLASDFDWYAQVDDVTLFCWGDELWGDVDCSGAVNSVDALKVLRFAAALSVAQTDPCPDMNTQVSPDFITTRPMGDVDCGNAVNSVDALKLLRFGAGLSVGQTPPCPTVGQDVNLYY